MLTIVIFAIGLSSGYVASIWSWPAVRTHLSGFTAEIARLRARAEALETLIRGDR